jgi:uncharacterized protein (DUF486 family)
MSPLLRVAVLIGLAILAPIDALASEPREKFLVPDPTEIPAAVLCLVVFFVSYLVVMTEEKTHLRKSKPVILVAGIIWGVIALVAPSYGVPHEELEIALMHDLDEYAGLALFLMAAMTYISAL